ncbi:MAG: sensor histidine kinase [Stenomitos frigidus ULC029]
MLLNILDNAIKHSQPHTQLLIKGQRQGKQVEITVQDQGSGMSERDRPRVFDQFYTTDPSRQGSGSGLGLAIAKRIVKAHGGRICASSAIQGATFTIHLPL